MNKTKAAQFLPLIQAFAEGKQLQYRSIDFGWGDADNLSFSLPVEKYRIKPEPKEAYCVFYDDGNVHCASSSRSYAQTYADGGWVVKKMVEAETLTKGDKDGNC